MVQNENCVVVDNLARSVQNTQKLSPEQDPVGLGRAWVENQCGQWESTRCYTNVSNTLQYTDRSCATATIFKVMT